MKKLHYFLSLLSFLLIGAVSGQVQAQTTYPAWRSVYYADEEPIAFSDIKFDGKTPYALRGIHSSDFGAPETANFLADGKYSAEASNVYVFEPTGEQVDGHDTYYLKNFQTGQYLRYNESTLLNMDISPEGEAVDGASVIWVSDKKQAAKMTILQAQGDNRDDFRSYCANKTENLAAWHENSVTFVFDKSDEDGNFYGLNCMNSPVYSTYVDTKAWDAYTVTEAEPYESLGSLLLDLGATPNAFTAGTTPGYFPQNFVDAYNAAYAKIDELINKPEATLEECKAAYNVLVSAMSAAKAGVIMPDENKYYYLKSGKGGTAYVDGTVIRTTRNFEAPKPEGVSGSSAKYWWKFKRSEDGKTFIIQNYYSGQYVGHDGIGYKSTFPMVAEPDMHFKVETADKIANAVGQFYIIPDGDTWMWNESNYNTIVSWNDLADVGNGFTFTEVSSEAIAAGEALIEQDKVNVKMNALLPVVNKFVQNNVAYTTNFDVTDLTQKTGDLVTSANQLLSNAKDSEGSYEGLTDANVTTYFHTNWRSGFTTPDGRPHALSIDLGKEVQEFTMRTAKRNHQNLNNLVQFDLYTSNDSVTWSYAGAYTIKYNYTCTKPEGYTVASKLKNNVGIAGIHLTKPQRYLRLEMVGVEEVTTRLHWTLSELQIFEGVTEVTDPAQSPLYNPTVPAETRDALLSAVNEANAEKPGLTFTKNEDGTVTVTSGAYKASEALYEKIQSLYNELVKIVPDVDAFKTQLDSIKTAAGKMEVGSAVGYFPQEAKDEFGTAFANIETLVSPTMGVDDINSARESAFAALNKFKGTFNMPTEGKVYAIRCAGYAQADAPVVNAIAYSDATDTTTWIRERGDSVAVAGQDGKQKVDVVGDLRYMWLAEKVNGKNIVLRNLGTGMYFGKPDSIANSQYIRNSAVPHEQSVISSGRSGVLNFLVADGFLVNFHGGGNGYGLIVWETNKTNSDTATGSAIKFEEISADAGSFDEQGWNLGDSRVGAYQILTLPFSGETAVGETYTVLGQRKDGESYTLELQSTGGEFEAGVPFVYVTTENDSLANEIALYRLTSGLQEVVDDLPNYVTTGEHKSDALVGVTLNTTLKDVVSGTSVFDGKEVHAITGRQSWRGYDIYGNTGYILPVETEEVGDLSIPLDGPLTTGITEAELNANSAVDVYTISGVKVRKNVKASKATAGLPAGIYVVGGQKVLVK